MATAFQPGARGRTNGKASLTGEPLTSTLIGSRTSSQKAASGVDVAEAGLAHAEGLPADLVVEAQRRGTSSKIAAGELFAAWRGTETRLQPAGTVCRRVVASDEGALEDGAAGAVAAAGAAPVHRRIVLRAARASRRNLEGAAATDGADMAAIGRRKEGREPDAAR